MNELKEFIWAEKYVKYLELKIQGLKKQANVLLQDFIKDFQLQDKLSRRQFMDAVFKLAYTTDEISLYLPYNLWDEIFTKEISSWIQDDPVNATPYKWSNNFELIKKSLEINPYDQETLYLFGKNLINKIGMNQHEIAAGFSYQGDPFADLQLIKFYKPLLINIEDGSKRKSIEAELNELEYCALQHMG